MNQFIATMPDAYERLYGANEIAEHAAIVSRRGERLVHAEFWPSAKGPLLCIVAEDRPGLLALVTDALLAQGMAVQSARAFCRELGKDRVEAVDFLQLHALGGPESVATQFEGAELHAFVESLNTLVADDLARTHASSKHPPPAEPKPSMRIYFERQSLAEGRYLLVVDAPDSDGLLHAVSSALHAKGMRIIACESRTVEGRARDRFEVEPGTPRTLSDGELCDVQFAVLDALRPRP